MNRYSVESIPEGLVIVFASDVTTEDSGAIKELMRKNQDARRIIVDLSKVSLITTPGLGTLVSVNKACKDQQRRLLLCGLSPYVNEIFDLTRLSPIFEIFPTRDAAIAAG